MLNCKGLRPRAHGERCPARGVAAAAAPAAAGAAVTQAERGVFQKRKERGVLILPGLANNAADYAELAENLRQRGLAAQVVQVGRADWGRNAAALTDSNWWKGTLRPRPAVNWYLERVETALDDLKRQVDGAPITLLCHSVRPPTLSCHTFTRPPLLPSANARAASRFHWKLLHHLMHCIAAACAGWWLARSSVHAGFWYRRH
jgi:hypothetical protein